MPILHLALSTRDVAVSIADLSQRLGAPPVVVVPGVYALWRTPQVNCSLRYDPNAAPGTLRHLGWEDPHCEAFTAEEDCHGLLWERFSAEQQLAEIRELWPTAEIIDED
ncbi:MAG: hypothetical protein EA402_08285 [Planctomycetota bacterium]|nr:MAG: hypothetical protein EA402_08285 [Planctomycetota bacterium]